MNHIEKISADENFIVVSDFDKNTTECFYLLNNKNLLWKIDQSFQEFYLSTDSSFLITLDGGFGFLSKNYKNKDHLFSVYKNGELVYSKKIGDVIKTKKNLQKTVSHYRWGNFVFADTNFVIFDTVEGFKIYSLEEKKLTEKDLEKINIPWTEKEILGKTFFYSDETKSESMQFSILDKEDSEKFFYIENKIVVCTFVKKSKNYSTAIAPILYWTLDSMGNLFVYNDSTDDGDAIKIKKLCIDEKSKKIYAIENSKFVCYDFR